MTINEMKELALHAARGTAPSTFSIENVEDALRDAFAEMAGSVNQFMKNRYDIYEILVETADQVVPQKVIDSMGRFAEVKVVADGQKAIFKRRVGKERARQFLTQAAMSGVYRSFRIDTETFEVTSKTIGGACTVDFQRFLDGAETMSDLMDIMTTGLVDAVFLEVQNALVAAFNASKRPAANKYTGNNFDAKEMMKLVSTVRSYGQNAIIFAPQEFVAEMGPDAIVPISTFGSPTAAATPGVYSPDDIQAIHDTGYINLFRGVPVILMKNTFTDKTNTKTWLNPQMAYILPTGGEKVVKVVIEGPTQIKDHDNVDNSMEIHFWKKFGAAIFTHHDWAIYNNSGITNTYENPYGNI